MPLGVPRFKKLPNKISEVPKFQSLPTSTSQKFESLTKVETFPANAGEDDKKLEIDLKGHTIEELAIMANVSVDVIKKAIKLRQHQMKLESKFKESNDYYKENKVTFPSSTTEIIKSTTQTVTTTTKSESTTQPITFRPTYVPKKKIKKHPIHNGHKVNILTIRGRETFHQIFMNPSLNYFLCCNRFFFYKSPKLYV